LKYIRTIAQVRRWAGWTTSFGSRPDRSAAQSRKSPVFVVVAIFFVFVVFTDVVTSIATGAATAALFTHAKLLQL
jgi:MFS superfamily sulfate permease-like transporter